MLGKIIVVNKRNHKQCKYDYYVGRPSPLGNPYSHIADKKTLAQYVVPSREIAIGKYQKYLDKCIKDNVFNIHSSLQHLLKKYKAGEEIHLVCWCHPLPCHATAIKQLIEDMTVTIDLYAGSTT